MGGSHIAVVVLTGLGALGCNTLLGFSGLEETDCQGGDCGTGGSGTTILDDAAVGLLVTGRHGTCAVIDADGSVKCWGQTTGNLAQPSSTRPVTVDNLLGVSTVVLGLHHRCALTTEAGKVYCWGDNDHGQLGNGTDQSSLTPVEVEGMGPIERISGSGNHTCATTFDDPPIAFCWGANTHGQLGVGDLLDRWSPVEVPGLGQSIRVAVGDQYTCSVSAGGELYCWGRNDDGQLGIDPLDALVVVSPQLVTGVPPMERIYPSDRHTCARTQGKRELTCWGNNDWGQLGDGTTVSRHTAVVVAGLSETSVGYPGQRHTCVTDTVGLLTCFGANDYGQLGLAATTTPVTAPVVISEVTSTVGAKTSEHTCFIEPDGPVLCMGLNVHGQLGDGTYEPHDVPTPVSY